MQTEMIPKVYMIVHVIQSIVTLLKVPLLAKASLQITFACRVVIWPDKDQVLRVKTPVW